MQKSDKLIYLGVITGAHGIKGNVVVHSLTKPSTNITKLKIHNESGDTIELKLIRAKSDHLVICSAAGVIDRNAAEALRGTKIYTRRSCLPKLDESECYVEDISGLEVLSEDRKKVGNIAAMHNFGAGDIVEIDFNNGSNEMYPFAHDIFPEVTKQYVVFVPPTIIK